jgi:uncharacterized protein (DUF2062 family)
MCQPGPQRQPTCWIGEATLMESDEASGMAWDAVAPAMAIAAATSSLVVSLIAFLLVLLLPNSFDERKVASLS